MAYIPLNLPNSKVSAVISMATEAYLEEAHYLLISAVPDDKRPIHFGRSATVMTLLAIAAASAVRRFDVKKNKNLNSDRASFESCVLSFFPWSDVSIGDAQNRSEAERRKEAARALYDTARNPLVHTGGLSSMLPPHRTLTMIHDFPGLASLELNEQKLIDYCNNPLKGKRLIQLDATSVTIHTRPLYWCARQMIESFATDPNVQADIANNAAA